MSATGRKAVEAALAIDTVPDATDRMYEVQVWCEQHQDWEVAHRELLTEDAAGAAMLDLLGDYQQGRVIEVRTVVTRTVVRHASYMGISDDEIVTNVQKGRMQ
jgi:hypothetical protein